MGFHTVWSGCANRLQRSPFPLVAYDSRSVLTVKGPLRRVPRPGPLRADPKGIVFYEKKEGFGFRAVSGPKGSFRPYQRLEPQHWGRVTRRTVAERGCREAA